MACDPSSGLTLPSVSAIASAYKIQNNSIADHQGISRSVGEALNSQGPFICEVMTDPNLVTAPRLSSEVRQDGSIVSKPLEDLWPFLDRKEFYENMIIPPLDSV